MRVIQLFQERVFRDPSNQSGWVNYGGIMKSAMEDLNKEICADDPKRPWDAVFTGCAGTVFD